MTNGQAVLNDNTRGLSVAPREATTRVAGVVTTICGASSARNVRVAWVGWVAWVAGIARLARRLRFALLTACVMCLASGCAMFGGKGDKVSWDHLSLVAADDVNNNSPVAVDVVFVTDDTLLARVAELPASKWFAARADLASTFPKSVQYRSWELVPGQRINVPGDVFGRPRVLAAFLFANYADPGAQRVRIEPLNGAVAVQLDNHTFSVSAVK
jgi:type VI secretion system protein